MRGILIAILILAGGRAEAAGAPIAAVNKVSGLVRVARAGIQAQEQVIVGFLLSDGDRISTLSGRVEIKFGDGHYLRLTENASLEIMAPAKGRKGFFTRLLGGRVRAIAARMKGDESFEIQSPYAVASVKGTDFLFDGRGTTVRDEGDADGHSVELRSLSGRVIALIGEGMTGGLNADGSTMEPRPAEARVLEEMERHFDVEAGAGTGSSGSGDGGGGEGDGSGGDGGSGDSGEGGDDKSDLFDEVSDFADSDGLANYYDWMERTSDLELGKVILDRHGNRVEMEHYNYLLSTNTIEYLVLNFRDGGPSAGLTAMTTDLVFNTDLPADRFDDVRRGLSAAFRDTANSPAYWLKESYRSVTSPNWDEFREAVWFADPVMIHDAPGRIWMGTWWAYSPEGMPTGWGQAFEYARSVTENWVEQPLEHYMVTEYGDVGAGWYLGAYPVDQYPVGSVNFQGIPNDGQPVPWFQMGPTVTGNMWWMPAMYEHDRNFNTGGIPEDGIVDGRPVLGNSWFGYGTREVSAFPAGGGMFRTLERTFYGDPASPDTPVMTVATYLVDDAGAEQDPVALLSGTADAAAFDAALENANIEVEYGWNNPHSFADWHVPVAWVADLLLKPNMFRDSFVMQTGAGIGEQGGAPGLGF